MRSRVLVSLFVLFASCGTSGSSGGSASCSDDIPQGDHVTVDWITFRRWLAPPDSVAVFVAFADSLNDRGAENSGRRKVELRSPEVLMGELPKEFFVGEDSVARARATKADGRRLVVWGWPGFPKPKVFGNLVLVAGDGGLTFVGNCIPRFDPAFAAFVASGGASEPAVEVLVRILTDPTGETAQRFNTTAGMTRAGP